MYLSWCLRRVGPEGRHERSDPGGGRWWAEFDSVSSSVPPLRFNQSPSPTPAFDRPDTAFRRAISLVYLPSEPPPDPIRLSVLPVACQSLQPKLTVAPSPRWCRQPLFSRFFVSGSDVCI